MPLPQKLVYEEGYLTIDETFSAALAGYAEPRLERAALRLVRRLSAQTGIPLRAGLTGAAEQATLVLQCEGAANEVQGIVEDESYRLRVTPDGAEIRAPKPYGVLHGIESFLQLIRAGEAGFFAPAVRIEDKPRFPWRGLMIDVCRHWIPVEAIKRNLDAMAAAKLNVFHWHLTEDQGFRVESKCFPNLHKLGSDGDYYTQDEVREIVAYARDRGIRVVPEFDMPGHATAWFVGYPELASAPGPYEIRRVFGIGDPTMDPTREEVYEFLGQLFDEMVALFPDPCFHIGGDEVSGVHWDENPRIQAFIQNNDLQDNQGLQAYFNQRVQALLAAKGKSIVGWDEVLHPDLPNDTIVQSWRGQASLAEAAIQGYRGILSHGFYLDYHQPAAFHYGVDPIPTPEESVDISGSWDTWRIQISTPEGSREGRLTLSGEEDEARGIIEFEGTELTAGVKEIQIDGPRLSFEVASGFGTFSADLQREGDDIEGLLWFGGHELPLEGTRTAGSDIPGTQPPLLDGVRELGPDQAGSIMGGEACMWTELVNPETVDSRVWPRMAAVAERLWSPAASTTDVAYMYRRLAAFSAWLSWTGLRHRSNLSLMLKRMTDREIEPLETLASVVAPLEFYGRHGSRQYTQFTPLNRLVDAVPCESDTARALLEVVERLVDSPGCQSDSQTLEAWLMEWRDNHAMLKPALDASFLLRPLAPLSQNLAEVAAVGLEALQVLRNESTVTDGDQQRWRTVLDRAMKPHDELQLKIVPAVRKLTEATGA
jgi:hexosaminidase